MTTITNGTRLRANNGFICLSGYLIFWMIAFIEFDVKSKQINARTDEGVIKKVLMRSGIWVKISKSPDFMLTIAPFSVKMSDN